MKLSWLICLITSTAAWAAGVTDFVDLGDAQTTIVGDFVGGHDMRRPARLIGEGGEATFELRVAADEPLTLEIEEFDSRGRDVRAYHVLVDDKPVYFRTWRQAGAGPVHYFVKVPPPGRERIVVRLVNPSAAVIAVGRVWVWGDFEEFFDANRFDLPYYLAPTVRLSGDIAKDRRALQKIKTSFGERANVKPAWTTLISYAKSGGDWRKRIDVALQLAEEFNLPVQIGLNSWWGGTPGGPDGKGGRWADVQYQQVVWNDTHKRMQLSIPNRWASVPWLTMNHPDLNAFKVARVTAAAAYLRQAAARRRHLVLAVSLDNEPIYWANGNAGLGEDLKWADFNPYAVAAAKADGVTLDPRDGLSREERIWLWKNLLRYNEMIASAAVDALRDGEPSDDPLADNVYTQAMMMADPERQYPTLDPAYPLWETAAPAAVHVGGEWNGDTRTLRQLIEHQIALGRNAATNAECDDNANEHRGVRMGYALGQRFYTPYNYPLDQMNVAAADLDDVSTPFPAEAHEPTVADFTFDDEQWTKHAVSHDGVVAKLIGNTAAVALFPRSAAEAGAVTWQIARPQGALALELSCRANDFRAANPAVRIRVLAGESPDVAGMREMKVIAQSADLDVVHRVDLADVAPSAGTLFLRIELHAPALPAEFLSWCALYRVRVTKQWPRQLVEGLPAQDESLRLVRKQNLLVSWRRDAELAIERLEKSKRAAAEEAYRNGRYAEAYRIAARAAGR